MTSQDREYVERILAGEPEVFESLVRKYNRMGGAIAYGITGDMHLAEDVVQEAFLKAFRSLHTLRDPGKFRVWFAGLVRSKAIDFLRQRRSHTAVSLTEGSQLPSGSRGRGFPPDLTPEDEVLREESRRKVLEAMDQLPPEDRLVVALKHMEGLSYREIAELTGSTESAVESRLFRARTALRKKLDPSET